MYSGSQLLILSKQTLGRWGKVLVISKLLFYVLHFADHVKTACRQPIFYLRNVCLMALVLEVSSESNFVEHLLWFHFIWNLAEKESWREKNCLYTSPVHSWGRIWINYDSVWNQYLGDWDCDVFWCILLQYYIWWLHFCWFFYVQSYKNEFLLVYFIDSLYRWATWM